MIEIVIEEQLRIITSYSRDNEILQSFNKYSYLPLELVNLYNKNNTVTYLLNAKSILDYLEKIFQLVKFTKQTQIKIKDEQKKDKIKLNSTNIELSGHEKDYYIEMVYGKKLFPACKQLLSYSLAPKQLHDWVIEKENRIRDVTEPSEYNPKYPNTNVNELDIYRFMCMDLLNMFSYIFPNYFTTTRFFSNTGKSFLTLDDELYCYFIGNKKGYIPMIDKVPYFLREYDEEYYNRIFNDIKTLSDQISEAVQLSQIIPKKINNNDGTNPIFEKFFETHEITENIFDYLSKSGQKTLNKNRNKSLKDYQRYATSQGFSGIENEFKNKNFNDPRLQNISKILNKDAKDMTWDEIKGAANKEIHESYNRKATFTDVMGYYKVPQIATGVAGTAWLVNKLSDDRGQQTNAQLYNQEPY